MEQANVKVSFYLKKSEADADGMCPVMARLNIGKYSEAAFSLKLRVPQAIWSSGRASGKSVKAKEINNRLDEIRAMALGIYAELSVVLTVHRMHGVMRLSANNPCTVVSCAGSHGGGCDTGLCRAGGTGKMPAPAGKRRYAACAGFKR